MCTRWKASRHATAALWFEGALLTAVLALCQLSPTSRRRRRFGELPTEEVWYEETSDHTGVVPDSR